MTHPDAVGWPDVAVPGTVNPAELPDTFPDQATTGGPVYWNARPHHSRLAHLPAGQAAVTSLAEWKRRRNAPSDRTAATE